MRPEAGNSALTAGAEGSYTERWKPDQENVLNRPLHSSLAAALLLAAASSTAHATSPVLTQYFEGPTPYLSFDDSPFKGPTYTYFHLETFEGAATPGYTVNAGHIGTSAQFTDSVDADGDGVNGSGLAGRSWYSGNATNTFVFTFSLSALGTLPTHAGIVWTDVGNVTSGTAGFGDVTFTAYDAKGNLIGTSTAPNLGDGFATGATAEDRFFGAFNLKGISRIEISMANSVDWEVDHLQYGSINPLPVPEPEQWLLMALGVAAVAGAARRRTH